jgi:hypothetical protein
MPLDETLIRTTVVYEGRYLRAEERTVRLPDGREGRREIVVPPDAVGVLRSPTTARCTSCAMPHRPAARSSNPAGIWSRRAPDETARAMR